MNVSSSLIDFIGVDHFLEKHVNARGVLLKILGNDLPKGYHFSTSYEKIRLTIILHYNIRGQSFSNKGRMMQKHEEIKIPLQILWTTCIAVNDLVITFSREVQMTLCLMC